MEKARYNSPYEFSFLYLNTHETDTFRTLRAKPSFIHGIRDREIPAFDTATQCRRVSPKGMYTEFQTFLEFCYYFSIIEYG